MTRIFVGFAFAIGDRLTLKRIVAATFLISAGVPAHAGPQELENTKWICVLGQTAGIVYSSSGAQEPTAKVIRFEERHRKFVLTISKIERGQYARDLCQGNIGHWLPKLLKYGTFDPKEQASSGLMDFGKPKEAWADRRDIAPCFASNEASMKWFDRDSPDSSLFSYDYPTDFTGPVPGYWLRLYPGATPVRFEAGESLDAGPVVSTGSCERIE